MAVTADPYRVLGSSYASSRRPDPRIARQIRAALGAARTVINIGAGTGSYEPAGLAVTAVEPSPVMISQRPPGSAPVVRGYAESLPFGDQVFDAALAVLTVHHWRNAAAGLAEMRRVAARQVVLTWDPAVFARYWLVRDYLPQIAERERGLACLSVVTSALTRGGGRAQVSPVMVPADCADGFLGAHWRRPEAYLDPGVRAAMSGIALLDPAVVAAGIGLLARDLSDGRWHSRQAPLLDRAELDLGYRLVVTGP
jgi:SAM-dependent methyltransferase